MAEAYLYSYPQDLPIDALQLVWDAFKGNPLDVPQVINAGWWVGGYALGQIFPEGVEPTIMSTKVGSDAVGLSDAKVDEAFHTAMSVKDSPDMVRSISPEVWLIIRMVVQTVLERYL